MNYTTLLIGFVVGFLVTWLFIKPKSGSVSTKDGPIAKRRQLAINCFKNNEEITYNQYQELTGVSNSQATRDLDELEEQGIVEQIGITGQLVKYRRK